MPKLAGNVSELTQPIYDTVQLAAVAAQTVQLFAVPLGGIIAGAVIKTRTHTNLIQAGRLERDNQFTLYGFSMFIRQTAVGGARRTWADYNAVYNNSNLDIQFGQKPWFHYQAAQIPAGPAELYYFSNIVAAATEFEIVHGLSTVMNILPLYHPLIIEPGESIAVFLNVGDTIAAVTDVTFVMWGQLLRPVA